ASEDGGPPSPPYCDGAPERHRSRWPMRAPVARCQVSWRAESCAPCARCCLCRGTVAVNGAEVRPIGDCKVKALLLVSELEDYTISYANGVARHISVIVGVPHRNYARLASWFDPSVDLRLLDWPRHSSLTNPNFLLALTKLIRQERPDLIHLLSNSTLWLNFAAPFWRPI